MAERLVLQPLERQHSCKVVLVAETFPPPARIAHQSILHSPVKAEVCGTDHAHPEAFHDRQHQGSLSTCSTHT